MFLRIFPAWNFHKVHRKKVAWMRACVYVRASGMWKENKKNRSRDRFVRFFGKMRRVDGRKSFFSHGKNQLWADVVWVIFSPFMSLRASVGWRCCCCCVGDCTCTSMPEGNFPSSHPQKHFQFILRKNILFSIRVVYRKKKNFFTLLTHTRTTTTPAHTQLRCGEKAG